MFAVLATAAISATTVYAQASSPEAIATQTLLQLSNECRSAVLSLATSPLTQCLNLAALAPAISSNTSIVPVLDNWMTSICASEPCSQEVLESAAQNFSSACAQDVESYGVEASDIEGIFGLYPLARELVCLQATEPFSADNSTSIANSTSSSNTTTSSNSNPSSNSTEESTFCVTSVLEELSSYLGTNLTVNGIFGLVLGSDQAGRTALTEIPPTALCQDCIYSAAGLIEQQYPGIWSQPLVNGNFTVGGYLNETCSNETFPVIDSQNNTITLPESVFPSAENSTYPYGIVYFNGTYAPEEDVVEQPPALPFANVAAAPLSNETETSTVSSASSSATVAASSVTSAPVSITSAVSSAAVSSASAAVQQRDVTAAKRRWVGQV